MEIKPLITYFNDSYYIIGKIKYTNDNCYIIAFIEKSSLLYITYTTYYLDFFYKIKIYSNNEDIKIYILENPEKWNINLIPKYEIKHKSRKKYIFGIGGTISGKVSEIRDHFWYAVHGKLNNLSDSEHLTRRYGIGGYQNKINVNIESIRNRRKTITSNNDIDLFFMNGDYDITTFSSDGYNSLNNNMIPILLGKLRYKFFGKAKNYIFKYNNTNFLIYEDSLSLEVPNKCDLLYIITCFDFFNNNQQILILLDKILSNKIKNIFIFTSANQGMYKINIKTKKSRINIFNSGFINSDNLDRISQIPKIINISNFKLQLSIKYQSEESGFLRVEEENDDAFINVNWCNDSNYLGITEFISLLK